MAQKQQQEQQTHHTTTKKKFITKLEALTMSTRQDLRLLHLFSFEPKKLVLLTLERVVFFAGVRSVIHRILALVFGPSFTVDMDRNRQFRFELYTLSQLNCIVMTIYSLRGWWNKWQQPSKPKKASSGDGGGSKIDDDDSDDDDDDEVVTSAELSLSSTIKEISFTKSLLEYEFAYFVHDLICILPNWRQYPADIFHHAFGLAIITVALKGLKRLYSYVPLMYSMDATTLLLNAMWFLRELNLDGKFVKTNLALQKLFALLFFLIRVVWYPYFVHDMRANNKKVWREIGRGGKVLIGLIMGLQLYWFSLIMKKFVKG